MISVLSGVLGWNTGTLDCTPRVGSSEKHPAGAEPYAEYKCHPGLRTSPDPGRGTLVDVLFSRVSTPKITLLCKKFANA